MAAQRTARAQPWLRLLALSGCWFILFVPGAFLVAASLRTPQPVMLLWTGTCFQLGLSLLAALSRHTRGLSLGPAIVTLYLTGLTWLWFGDTLDDSLNHLAKAVMIVVPVVVFGYQTIHDSGAAAVHHANVLARRLADRHEWPSDFAGCRVLPEVKAFRAALTFDPTPALALLEHPRTEVRVAALAALEFRKDWRPGQAEHVLQLAQRAEVPALRAAAVTALGNLDDRAHIEALSHFLHDNSLEVRRAAIEALFWEGERRWPWIRFAVRRILADPLFLNDGPLLSEGQALPKEAVDDLMAWCAEKGTLSARAATTLAAHYSHVLSEQADPQVIKALRAEVAHPQTAAVLRLELAKVLQLHQELDPELLESMLSPTNPAPMRLIACDTILAESTDGLMRNAAISALRDLARVPNRELALIAADLVQRRLGVDLGMGLGAPLPPVHSRQAAEIVRRVTLWATHDTEEDLERSGFPRMSLN